MKTAGKARRIAVVVLGMHRSGTSALARVLNLLGCDLPINLYGAGTGNETGHWEPSSVIAVNERLLPSAGSYMHDWQAISEGWLESPKAAEFLDDAIAALKADYEGLSFFVLKEPRICRVFPLWKQALESVGVSPVVMIPVRNPVEVTESLKKRDGFDSSWGYLMWLRNVVDAERDSRGLPRHFSTYDQLLDNWGVVAKGAEPALGVKWPIPFDKAEPEIERFLSKSQRHNVSDQSKVLDNPLMSPWVKDVYGIMLRWAATGEDKSDWAALDRIRAEMAAAEPAFGRAVAAGWGAALWGRQLDQKQVEIRTEMENKQQAIAKAEKSIGTLTATNADLQAALEETRAELSVQRSQVDVLEREGDKGLRDNANLAQSLKAAEEQLAVRFSEIVKLTELAQRREDERLATQAALSDAQVKLASGEMALRDARAKVSAAQTELTRLDETRHRNMEDAEARIAQLNAEIARLNEVARHDTEQAAYRDREQQRALDDLKAAHRAELDALSARLRVSATEYHHRIIEAIVGWEPGLSIPGRSQSGAKEAILGRIGLFDSDFYRSRYPDVASANIDPLTHFVRYGAREGRYWSEDIATLAEQKRALGLVAGEAS